MSPPTKPVRFTPRQQRRSRLESVWAECERLFSTVADERIRAEIGGIFHALANASMLLQPEVVVDLEYIDTILNKATVELTKVRRILETNDHPDARTIP